MASKYLGLFTFALCLEIALVFILNSAHTNQQYIYEFRYSPLSVTIYESSSYPVLYPLWGYPFLLSFGAAIQNITVWILTLQAVLCLISILVFYKLTDNYPKFFHLVLFLPFIALMSVKWPDAIVGFLLIYYALGFKKYLVQPSKKMIAGCGVLLGLISNFRGEYLYIGLLILILFPIFSSRIRFKPILQFSVLTTIIGFLFMIPWGINTLMLDGKFRIESTNSGLVLYTTLGQLPNNPWQIIPTDKFAEDFVHSHGISNPYSNAGDSILKKEFLHDIETYPLAFVEKVGINFITIFVRGVYIGEYSKVTGLDTIDKIIKGIYTILFSLMLLNFFWYVGTHRKQVGFAVEWIPIICIVFYKVIIVSFIQYEPRHMNAIYLLVLSGVFISIKRLGHKRFPTDVSHLP